MPKQNKKELQALLECSQRDNQALEQRLLDLEARFKSIQSGTIPQAPITLNSMSIASSTSPLQINPLMTATAKMIQDSSNVEKTSPFLSNVDDVAWKSFSLKYLSYRQKGGNKSTRDLLSPEVINYYKFQIDGDISIMPDDLLFQNISHVNLPVLDPMSLLISSISMKPSKIYNKKCVQEYISEFITLLSNYPKIQEECAPHAIVKQFFKKIQPNSLSEDMLNLQINDVHLAIRSLHSKLRTKDIQLYENTRESKKSLQTELKDTSTAITCCNCKFSTKPDYQHVHKLWNCRDIDFCFRCKEKHLALGPNCKFKDKSIFDYDKYAEKKKKTPTSVPSNKKEQKVANVAKEDFVTKSDLLGIKDMFLEHLQKIDKKLDWATGTEVSKKLSGESIIIDSGCSHTCINTPTHSASPIKFNRMEYKDSIWVADGRSVEIVGTGKIFNHECSLVPSFASSLLSVAQTNKANNSIAIFTNDECHVIKLDNEIKKFLTNLKESAIAKNLVLINGSLVNGVYVFDSNDIKKDLIDIKKCYLIYDNITTTASSVENFNLAAASYYTNVPSVGVESIKELIRFFHETWNHASMELMILIVKNKLIQHLPEALTEKAIRKHFPNCNACPIGNLQQRPFQSIPEDREIEIGSEWEIDLMGPVTDEQQKKCPSFSGAIYGMVCKDIKSKKRFGFLLRNRGYLLRYLKHLILLCQHRKYKVTTFRIDDEFVTEEIETYCAKHNITLLPCIPHEHATLGNVERDNRTIREAIMKSIASKPHLTIKYWGMCFHDTLFKMDLMPHASDPTKNSYMLWYDKTYDMLKQPLLEFGCIVMAHVPLALQGMLSGRAVETYYVGAHINGRHGGMLLYNPLTKKTIVRRTFRVLGPVRQGEQQLTYEAAYDDSENISHFSQQADVNNTNPSNDVIKKPEAPDDTSTEYPALVGDGSDSDSDNEEEEVVKYIKTKTRILPSDSVAQYGNDIVLENDPVESTSNRQIKKHEPQVPPPHEIEPEHFVVEKVINHKGSATRPSSMQLYVKWHGYDDSENSWISWRDNNQLAALDTYLKNNPEIVIPVFKRPAEHPLLRNKQQRIAKIANKSNLKRLSKITSFDTKINYLPPKSSSAESQLVDLFPHVGFGTFRKVPYGVPRNYADIDRVPNSDKWIEVTLDELKNMYKNTVWDSETIDENSIPKSLILPSQLLYEIQMNPDGTLKKFKCRLVIRGDKWYDIYEMDTYASTVKSETVRICLAIAATEDMEMESVDVKAAFLNSPLKDDEIIYMRRPPGLNDTHMPKIVRLKKCIYGMKQASAYFHDHSDKVLKSFGCIATEEDDCCYILNYKGHTALINKHVDDFGLMSKSKQLITYIKSKLSEVYEITVDPEMKFYLGLHLVRDRKNKKIKLDQTAMIIDMATRSTYLSLVLFLPHRWNIYICEITLLQFY